MRGPQAEAAATWAVERLAELRPENLFVLLKRGQLALGSSDRQEATGAYLRVRELLWQAPDLASEQLGLLLEGLEEADLEKTRRPAIILENILKAEVMYQRSLDELRTSILGIPVARLLDEPEPEAFGASVETRFTGDRPIELHYASRPITDSPTRGRGRKEASPKNAPTAAVNAHAAKSSIDDGGAVPLSRTITAYTPRTAPSHAALFRRARWGCLEAIATTRSASCNNSSGSATPSTRR